MARRPRFRARSRRRRQTPLPRLRPASADAKGGARRARKRSRRRDVEALPGLSFAVEPGEAVGLIGRNGSGKTTLLRLIAGIIKPTEGRVAVGGRIGSLLELGAGFHPEFTGRENVYLNGAILGLKRAAIRPALEEIVAFSELERFIDVPVRTYSSGMYMRLGFAVAAHLEVDVLLLDEVFAVGDEEFQRKCFGKIFEFKQRGGTIVFVSHDAAAVERLCPRAVLLKDGQLAFDGPTREAIDALPPAARRGARPRRARRRPQRVRKRRVPDHRRRCSAPTGDERRAVRAGRAARGRAPHRFRAAGLPPPRLACELRDEAGLAARGGRPGHCRARLAAGSGRAALPLRRRQPAARRRPLPTSASSSPTPADPACTTGSTTRLASSSIPRTAVPVWCGSTAAGRSTQSIAPLLQQAGDELSRPVPTGPS